MPRFVTNRCISATVVTRLTLVRLMGPAPSENARWDAVAVEAVLRFWHDRTPSIIDFPNLGLTYNGGWCTATETDETLITRPSCEVNVK